MDEALMELQIGARIRTNHQPVGSVMFIVKRIIPTGDGVFCLELNGDSEETKNDVFGKNDYHIVDGRIVKTYPWPPGSTGYHLNGGGRDGDGYDEIFVESLPVQPSLFGVG